MFFHIFTSQTTTHTGAFNALASRLCSAKSRRIAGLNASCFALPETPAGVAPEWTLSLQFGAGFFTRAVAFTQATKDLRDVTVVPSSSRTASRMPSADPVLPVPLCQFRFLPALHHVRCVAGFFMPGCDGGIGYGFRRSGTRISTLLIVYPLFIRRSRVINQILLLFLVNGHIPYRREAEAGRPA